MSDDERERMAELLAEGAPVWRLHQEINRSRYAIRRAVMALHRRPKREPRRSPLRLSLAEREEISRGLAAGESLRAIAARLGRAPSTVCREVAAQRRRAAGIGRARRTGRRCAGRAARSRRSWRCTASCARWWRASWSCAGRRSRSRVGCGAAIPTDPEMRVSHETIYLSLFVQSRGALRKELTRYLRRGQATRRPRGLLG